MTPEDLEAGGVYDIGTGCGVPYTFRPITFRILTVLQPKDSYHAPGTAWLDGEELNHHAHGARRFIRREIYVVTAGMRVVYSPRAARAQAEHLRRPSRAARNTGPVTVPRPRTPAETLRRTR